MTWQRVSPKRPCAICERSSWCVYDPLAGKVACKRVESAVCDEPWGWIHTVPPTPHEVDETQTIHYAASHTLSDEEAIARDRLYRELARHPFMRLTPADRADLIRTRHLDPATIARVGFFSYADASGIAQVARDLERFARENGLLEALWRLPGVYAKSRSGGGFLDCLVSLPHGALAIPVADAAGRWIAIHLRRRDEDIGPDGARYVWLSSRKQGGESPGAPIFLARPAQLRNRSRIVITEGVFKGLAAAEMYRCLAFALPGIDLQAGVLPLLEALRERGEIEPDAQILIAYDQEPDKPQVAAAQQKLHTTLRKDMYAVVLVAWDRALGKGFDDAFHAGAVFTENAPEKAPENGGGAPGPEDEMIAQVRQERDTALLVATAAIRQLTVCTAAHREKDKRIRKLEEREQVYRIPNEALGWSEKTNMLAIREEVRSAQSRGVDVSQGLRLYLPAIAQRAGCSAKTSSRVLPQLEKRGFLTERTTDKVYSERQGKKVNRITVFPNLEMLEHPTRIAEAVQSGEAPKRNHGGVRVPCPRCGSENVAQRRMKHCHDCGHDWDMHDLALNPPAPAPADDPESSDTLRGQDVPIEESEQRGQVVPIRGEDAAAPAATDASPAAGGEHASSRRAPLIPVAAAVSEPCEICGSTRTYDAGAGLRCYDCERSRRDGAPEGERDRARTRNLREKMMTGRVHDVGTFPPSSSPYTQPSCQHDARGALQGCADGSIRCRYCDTELSPPTRNTDSEGCDDMMRGTSRIGA